MRNQGLSIYYAIGILFTLIALPEKLLLTIAKAAPPILRVGMELSYPPFEMTDTAGHPKGISVELAKSLGESLGRPILIENIAFDGLIPALRTGTIDCIISSMTSTPERAKAIAFSNPYLKTGLTLLVGRDSPILSPDDITKPGVRIAVKLGTSAHKYAAQQLKKADVFVLDMESAAVLEVMQGKVDAFIYDSLSVYRHHRRHPKTTRAILNPFRQETWAIGLRKQDITLLQAINKFLQVFQATGGFEDLGEQFLPEEKAYFKANNIPFYF
ncbi:MAG: transporter substrate-binding domain-containing protein [Pirellulales bacterium]|nr:transporter substrate-binding domain-containing protein [Pirellulales bacterium]